MAHPAVGAPVPDNHGTTLFTLRNAPGGVIVLALGSGPFDALRVAVRELFAEVPARFKGAQVRLDFGQREIELFDLRRLLTLLKEFDVQLVGLHVTPGALHRWAEKELKLKVHVSAPELEKAADVLGPHEETPTVIVSEPAPPADDPEIDPGTRVLTVPGHVRSGALIRYGGDVQVFGDVNPGAQIVASGSVFVFGSLRGQATAGANGDDAIVFALDMRPSQLRIGRVIHITSEEGDRQDRPEIAYIADGSIVIEAYRGRHPHLKELA